MYAFKLYYFNVFIYLHDVFHFKSEKNLSSFYNPFIVTVRILMCQKSSGDTLEIIFRSECDCILMVNSFCLWIIDSFFSSTLPYCKYM